MRVLKPGREQKGWGTEATCTGDGNGGGGCGALLFVDRGDLYHTTSCARDEVTHYVTFTCPNCRVETDVKNMPRNIWENIQSKEAWQRDNT